MTEGQQNIFRVYSAASEMMRSYGTESFWRYHRTVKRIARRFDFRLAPACGALAALSPQNDEEGLFRSLELVMEGHRRGLFRRNKKKPSSFGRDQEKALKILSGESPMLVLRGKKTCSFYLNVLDPSNPKPVTVDGHMFNIWTAQVKPLVLVKVDDKVYELIASDVRVLAKQENLIANQMQGIVWYQWKAMHGIHYKAQMSLFEDH